MTLDHLVLLVKKLRVVYHLGHNVHHSRRARKLTHSREAVAHILKHRAKTELCNSVIILAVIVLVGNYIIHLKIKVIGVLNIVYVGSESIVIALDMRLELFKIVCLSRQHGSDHFAHRIVNVDLVGVLRSAVVLINGGHCTHHSVYIARFLHNRKRVGRKSILLHLIDVELNTV